MWHRHVHIVVDGGVQSHGNPGFFSRKSRIAQELVRPVSRGIRNRVGPAGFRMETTIFPDRIECIPGRISAGSDGFYPSSPGIGLAQTKEQLFPRIKMAFFKKYAIFTVFSTRVSAISHGTWTNCDRPGKRKA